MDLLHFSPNPVQLWLPEVHLPMGALRVHQVQLDGELLHLGQEEHPKASHRAGAHPHCIRVQETGASTTIRIRSGCIINWGQDPLRLIITPPNILLDLEGPMT